MLWAASFRRDYQIYVLAPVQRMVAILSEMTSNPRLAIARGGNQAGENDDESLTGAGGGGVKKPTSEMELIEACISKFGMLLKVGFGEAGMDIIAKNMMSSKGTFNPVVRGSKVWAVFGFCDIRNFTDCCEVLEEETMIFTNEIAFVVHGRVHSSGNIPFIHNKIHCSYCLCVHTDVCY